MPTYREPADPPSGLVDSTALAASVAQLEAAHAERQLVEKRRAEASQREAEKKAEERAARLKPRISMRRDPSGTLLAFPTQSPSIATTIVSSVGLVAVLVPVCWLLASQDGGMKLLSLIVAPLLAFPLLGLRTAWVHRRPLHFYATQNGYFIAYRTDPDAPFAMGRSEHLRFDIRWDTESTKKVMPKYGDHDLVEVYCDRLTVCDLNTLKEFGAEHGMRVD